MRLIPMLLTWAAGALAAAGPAGWVPARWYWDDPASLELLRGTPVNCLLVKSYTPALARAAAGQGIALLLSVAPGAEPAEEARKAAAAGLAGIVLEGDFPDGAAARVAGAAGELTVFELPSRRRMRLESGAPVAGTFEGVWPGIQVLEGGAAKAAPTGSPWIDTNAGFLRAVRGWGCGAVWLANVPPAGAVITTERYLQAIADAAVAGGRWVVALDSDLTARLGRREAAAVRAWSRITQFLRYFEQHPEWRAMQPYGRLAVVQDRDSGALLSGGILDMIGARHTPVRAVPPARLSAEALGGASLAVNVDAALPAEKTAVLRDFARSGGTLLTAPPGALDAGGGQGGFTLRLEKAELERVTDLWHDVQSMIGRRNLGVRLFNVASMLSSLLAAPGGSPVVLHLVNYSEYPVENVTAHVLGEFRRARLFAPDGTEKNLEVYPVEGGTGVDIPVVAVCATLRLD